MSENTEYESEMSRKGVLDVCIRCLYRLASILNASLEDSHVCAGITGGKYYLPPYHFTTES
jgi:hypothetical protein